MPAKLIGKKVFEAQDPTKFVPHGDRLLVREIEVEDEHFTAEGRKIFIARARTQAESRAGIPETNALETERGWKLAEIIAIGNGHRLEADVTVPIHSWFEVGDVVYVESLTGRKLVLQSETYHVVNQTDVLGKAPEMRTLLAIDGIKAAS